MIIGSPKQLVSHAELRPRGKEVVKLNRDIRCHRPVTQTSELKPLQSANVGDRKAYYSDGGKGCICSTINRLEHIRDVKFEALKRILTSVLIQRDCDLYLKKSSAKRSSTSNTIQQAGTMLLIGP